MTEIEPLVGWILVVLVVVVYDLWAVLTGHTTLSRQFQRWFRRYWWFRLLSIGVALTLVFHLGFGVP